jgi:hypothetical protein
VIGHWTCPEGATSISGVTPTSLPCAELEHEPIPVLATFQLTLASKRKSTRSCAAVLLRNGTISVRVRATETLASAGRAAAPNTPTICSRLDEEEQPYTPQHKLRPLPHRPDGTTVRARAPGAILRLATTPPFLSRGTCVSAFAHEPALPATRVSLQPTRDVLSADLENVSAPAYVNAR